MNENFGLSVNPSRDDYLELIRYFAQHWERALDVNGSRVFYEGMPSIHGKNIDGLEGFARLSPLLAQYLKQSHSRDQLKDFDARLLELLRNGLKNGTDPDHPGYWGDIEDDDQRTVEAADIALTIYIGKEFLWDCWDKEVQQHVTEWLSGALQRWVTPNNWLLFVALIGAVLSSLNQVDIDDVAKDAFHKFNSFYLGDGWYSDGNPQNGVIIDWYNAYQIHYALYFLEKSCPELGNSVPLEGLKDFGKSTLDLATPEGFPIFGRSVCYRMAFPTGAILAARKEPTLEMQARRALDVTWEFFTRNGALQNGVPTQGYFSTDLALLDLYSGPASPLWCTRSLVAAMEFGENETFWTQIPEALPIEVSSYDYFLSGPKLRIIGSHETAKTFIVRENGFKETQPSLMRRIKDKLKSIRIYNGKIVIQKNQLAYKLDTYCSDHVFWENTSNCHLVESD